MSTGNKDDAELIALLNSISESNNIIYDSDGHPIDEFLLLLKKDAIHNTQNKSREVKMEKPIGRSDLPSDLVSCVANTNLVDSGTNALEYDILLGLNKNYDYIDSKVVTNSNNNNDSESDSMDEESLSFNSDDENINYRSTQLKPPISNDKVLEPKIIKGKVRADVEKRVKPEPKKTKKVKKKLPISSEHSIAAPSYMHGKSSIPVVETPLPNNVASPNSNQNSDDPLLIKLKSYQLRHTGLLNTIRELEVKISNLTVDNTKKDAEIRQLQYKVNVLANATDVNVPKKIANVTNTNLVSTNQLLHQQANQLKVCLLYS